MQVSNLIQFTMRRDVPMVVLIVEDEALQQKMLETDLREMGYQTLTANNGQEALTLMADPTHNIGLVLMDRHMPVLDGLSSVYRMKDDPAMRRIPVIMVTGADSDAEVREGIDAGVFYYMIKPYQEATLRSVITAAKREIEQTRTLSEELKKHHAGFNLMKSCRFQFSTLEEAECLAAFAAHCYPEPERVLSGLAELLINAVEHGNLEIGYARKTALLESGTWRAEVERRQSLEEYALRRADLAIMHKDDGIYLVITDEGKGFDWQRYLTIDPSRAGDSHGRGIAQSRAMCFDSLSYNQAGNQVVAKVGFEKTLDW